MQDFRFALRQLLKKPGFTLVAVLTLALGIGANTALFTVINTVLLRSLPVEHPEELVQVTVNNRTGHPDYSFSYPFYEQLRDQGHSLSGLFAAGWVGDKDSFFVPQSGSPEAETIRGQAVSGNFFSVLSVPALLGRTLTEADNHPGAPQAVAVISHGFWQRRFGGDPSVIGKAVTFKDVPFVIVGVTPPGFFGFEPGANPDLWWPVRLISQIEHNPNTSMLQPNVSWLSLVGRLAPGVKRPSAEAELRVIFQRNRDEDLAKHSGKWSDEQRKRALASDLELQSAHAGWTALRDEFRQPLFVLMAFVAVIQLIASANVASLLLVQAVSRAREFSVRSALGAGRARLVRQLLTESVLLAAAGGLLGLLLAQGGTRALMAFMQLEADSVTLSITPDLRVLLFTTGVALVTGIFFGLVPAFSGSRVDLASSLKGSAGSIAGNPSRQRLHHLLVVAQVALSLVLLVGAGLFVQTLRNLKGMDMGFNRANVAQFGVDFRSGITSAQQRNTLYGEMLSRLEALPGAQAASLYGFGMLSGNGWSEPVLAEGGIATSGQNLECQAMVVGPKFFETLGMGILSGRDFNAQDGQSASETNQHRVAVINQAMARRYFGEGSPVGRRFSVSYRPEQKYEVVGLARDAKYGSLRQEAPPTFYTPLAADGGLSMTLAVRMKGATAPLTSRDAQTIVSQIHPRARVENFKTLEDVVDASVHRERIVAQLGSFFGLLALGLACLGLYGVLSFAVVQRTREIGVRVALGAQRSDVLSLIIGKGLKLALIGAVIGLAAGMGATRFVASLLYGLAPTDPRTFLGVLGLLALVVVLASWLPARRAAKVDPMEALRQG
ncbi:MAG TPA: ABC transporter permease [Candidatus Limnocylindria bacterium]|nr:ABC transporter permease [Candidatus Limnocylindria bacterium]